MLEYNPAAIFALFSGGDGSLGATAWAMANVPNCQVAHIVTGIGIKRTTAFVQDTCAREGWPLTIIRAKEDCGNDYREIVKKHGFPGPASHRYMYVWLKERSINELVRRNKRERGDKVALLTGICHDDSVRRTGYGGHQIQQHGAKLWVNHMYWAGKSWMHQYILDRGLPRNPIAELLGMSGECLCGAFASPGELELIRMADPETADEIEDIQREVREAGWSWGWGCRPPEPRDDRTPDMFMPMCVGCLKEQAA